MLNWIQKIDKEILFFIQGHWKSSFLDTLMVFVTSLGNGAFLWIFIAFLLLLTRKYQKSGLALICTICLSLILGDHIIKPLIMRPRPCHAYPWVPLLISCPITPSFPSGHSMVAAASATVLIYYHRLTAIGAIIIALAIAFSRIYLFVHYPSDALGGILLGILTSSLVILGINKLYKIIEDKTGMT
ncbi:MAG TPA: phosphatase PAP2 family protein [Clostridiales bacterium]|nr:phosphatase PAP2 family protein [Clostridiales bacterium]